MQSLNTALQSVPKDKTGKLPKEHLQLALDLVAPLAGLPPLGALDEVTKQSTNITDINKLIILNMSHSLHGIELLILNMSSLYNLICADGQAGC